MAKKSKLEEVSRPEVNLPAPLMAYEGKASSTVTRRNAASDIERTDNYTNIRNGLIPFRNSQAGYGGSSKNMDIQEAIILCQKAYYNIPIFRNTIDLMVDFTVSNIDFKGGNKKARDFFKKLLEKISSWDFKRQFFREFFRSGTVVVYRIEGDVTKNDLTKITQVYGSADDAPSTAGKIPVKYILLNPADIQLQGNISFSNPVYLKVLSDYELYRLRNPVTDEDRQVLENLPAEAQKLINQKGSSVVTMALPADKIVATFYNKQDYEPFAVPMGYPVLELINWKYEMIKQDMAIARTVQQAILLITMGAEPDKGGINHKNMEAMQNLFKNESVGRVLIADYTTKASFIIPDISELLNAAKYEIVERDIQLGLNAILTNDDKFANASIKVKIFVERLKQAQEAFLSSFLIPEIKRIAKNLGFKNYPTPFFEQIDLSDEAEWNRIMTRMYELGLLTPDETLKGIDTGTLPTPEDNLEAQKTFATQKKDGLYQPIVGGPADQMNLAEKSGEIALQTKKLQVSQPSGRPSGTKRKQSTKKVKPMTASYSALKLKDNLILATKTESEIRGQLLNKFKLKKLNAAQNEIVDGLLNLIVANEEPGNWLESAKKYVDNPDQEKAQRAEEVDEIAIEHQLNPYLAGLLLASKV